MMEDKAKRVKTKLLLIEDNPGDVLLIQEMLAETGENLFALSVAGSLAKGLASLKQNHFDLVILDLSLTDSQDIDTFVQTHTHAPDIPIVVLTGGRNEVSAIQIMRAGAQDYLTKGEIDRKLLIRSIRYAIERHGLMVALENKRAKQRETDEIESFERIAGPTQTDMTAKLFGMGPLKEILPEVFAELVGQYSGLMENALEKRAYKVHHDVSEGLLDMGESLGVLKALPRDVVEIHVAALSEKQTRTTPQKFKAYAEEGRLMLVEVMGYLTAYYRRYAVGR